MSEAPVDQILNLVTQDVLTYGSWILAAVILGVAVQMGVRERTPFYALMVLAAGVAAFAEPLYDEALMLYFYSTAGMYTHFTAFDIPQPIWTHSGYVVLYASAAIFAARRIRSGTMTPTALFGLAGIEFAMSCVFEMIGINGGTFEYWGPHVFRVFEYPLIIGILEAAQVVCFTVAAAQLRERVKSPLGLLGLFVVFPCTFFMANFGAGSAVIIALHLQGTNGLIVGVATVLSAVAAVVLVRGAGLFLPSVRARVEEPAVAFAD